MIYGFEHDGVLYTARSTQPLHDKAGSFNTDWYQVSIEEIDPKALVSLINDGRKIAYHCERCGRFDTKSYGVNDEHQIVNIREASQIDLLTKFVCYWCVEPI